MTGKMLFALQIIEKPEIVDDVEGEYQIILDTAFLKYHMNNLNKAINIMAKKGWTCVNLSVSGMHGNYGYALMKRIQ